MSLRAVIFDIGGVLEVNPRTGWPGRWAGRLRLDTGEFECRLDPIWRAGAIGALTLAEVEEQIGRALDIDQPAVAAMMEEAWAEYVGTLNCELARYFASLRPRYKTAILSNSFVGAREREQEAYGLQQMCDLIVYSHEVGCRKPDARIYQIVCDLLEVTPEEVVLVDDLQENVDGAKSVGMTGVVFANNTQTIADLETRFIASSTARNS